ncbi:C40 family peptidase [Dyella sp.]|uniref:C40 family peptidase n=1 Tax=Dyella sp. TaxID=1869338 RepID=UPI002ED006EB
MPLKRLTASALASALFLSAPLFAQDAAPEASSNLASFSSTASLLMTQLPAFSPAPGLAQSVVPSADALVATQADKSATSSAADNVADADDEGNLDSANGLDLRNALIGLAMKLRDIRYTRGGHDPSTGFDCSGFVRYVFAHAVGLELPTNSASQFVAGLAVKRADMRPGDLVFFRTAGRGGRGRISHVGIYIDNGQFIHSPSRGKTVRVDNLSEAYWAKRFAGAKRPEGIAQNG